MSYTLEMELENDLKKRKLDRMQEEHEDMLYGSSYDDEMPDYRSQEGEEQNEKEEESSQGKE